jgi:hypothetical protein
MWFLRFPDGSDFSRGRVIRVVHVAPVDTGDVRKNGDGALGEGPFGERSRAGDVAEFGPRVI